MRLIVISITSALMLTACQKAAEPENTAIAETPVAQATWPASLTVVGDGFPNPGDACRIIGESEATNNYLDDSATLVGCLSAEDAQKLGGSTLTTVDGVTLVSVPTPTANAGDGDGQGDALVDGTKYNATAIIRCSGYKGASAGMCDAGVMRNNETGAVVEVTLPDGMQRIIFFNPDGSFLSFSTAQADGTAAMKINSSRDGDTTIATIGAERYEIPDVLVLGD